MADASEVRITVSEEEFQNAISQFSTCKDNFTNAYLQEISAVFSLDSSWNGDASEAFKTQFNQMIDKLRTSDDTMESALTYLKNALTAYQNVTSEASNAFGAMEDTTDPFAEG